MEDFVVLTKKQVEYLYHILNNGWGTPFNRYCQEQFLDTEGYDPVITWQAMSDILKEVVDMDPDEVVAGFLIKRKVG